MGKHLQANKARIVREKLMLTGRDMPKVPRTKKKEEQTSASSIVNQVPEIALSETYTARDYEVILDLLYGLYTEEDSAKVRVFDPFVSDSKRTPWVTPRMLTERIETMLNQIQMREAA